MNPVTVFVILLATGSFAHGSDGGPRITTTNKTEIVINANHTISLMCVGKTSVNWTCPLQCYGDVIIKQVNDTGDPVYPFGTHLELPLAQHYHSGYYNCVTSNDYEKEAAIYIFVKDPSYPFVRNVNDLFLLTAHQYRSALFDCRPNSPDIEVQLSRDGEELKLGENQEDGTVLLYDNKVGFTMEHVNIKQGGMYQCKALSTSALIVLDVMQHSDSISKPAIHPERANAFVGDNLTLTCEVNADAGISFSMEWLYPSKIAFKEGRLFIGNSSSVAREGNNLGTQTGVRNMTIYNIQNKDEGVYTCVVQDHAENKNNNTRMIHVHDRNTSYINITLQEHETAINQTVGDTAKWVVDVEAFPEPVLSWYRKGASDHLKSNGKYTILTNAGGQQTKLEINNVNYHDRGGYVLQAINSGTQKTQQFTLTVIGSPVVEFIDKKDSYSFGKLYYITCSVVAFPPPNISWSFKPCESLQGCSSENGFIEISTEKYINKEKDDVEMNSTLEFLTTQSGFLKCSAKNEVQDSNDKLEVLVSDLKGGKLFTIWGPDDIITGESVTLICGASKENYTHHLEWYKMCKKSPCPISNKDYKISYKNTTFSYQMTLTIPNIKKSDSGSITCRAENIQTGIEEVVFYVDVQNLESPVLKRTNMNVTKLALLSTDSLNLSCSFSGTPRPTITWYKDKLPITSKINKYIITQNNESLYIPIIKSEGEGEYKCVGHNRVGRKEHLIAIKIKDKPGQDVGMIIAIIVVAFVLVILLCVLIIKIRKERKLRKELAVAGLKNFEEGEMGSLNPEQCVDDQAELLPYDKKWEFPRTKLKLGKQLGAGAFGVVMKADAYGLVEGETVTTVAVKMVKRNADFTYIKALASELKIMVHLGKHLNVVNLLGACTTNIAKRELLVIVEYCRFGNLHNYLLRHRESFIDQVDPKTGAIDPMIGANILSRAESFNQKPSGDNAPSSPTDVAVDYRVGAIGSQSDSSNMDGSVCVTPVGEDSCLMSNNSIQPEWRSNYRGDYKGTVRPICTRDLVCWAFQVARGMEYLAGRKVLHGDLAARNILLADDNIVKICDFGLAKSMYKSNNYKKKGDGPLPVKWMAIESIRDRVFSTQSDVWSFGIVLWEFFSLARTPYPGMEADEKLYNKLVDGYRMEKPPHATEEIYSKMQDCWKARPEQRPSFGSLSVQLGNLLEESVRQHYIELNDPYIDMNEQWLQSIGNDYLSMMTAPTYGNLVSPTEGDNDYVNSFLQVGADAAAGESSGYLCMKSPSSSNSPDIFSPRIATVGDTVFDFSTPQQKRQRFRETNNGNTQELHPIMLSESDSEHIGVNDLNKDSNVQKEDITLADHPVKTSTSFSNPSYQSMPPIKPSSDNYINMPQHKSASKLTKNIDLINDKLPSGFSNPSYISVGLVNDNKTPVDGNAQDPFTNMQKPLNKGGNEPYVNLSR